MIYRQQGDLKAHLDSDYAPPPARPHLPIVPLPAGQALTQEAVAILFNPPQHAYSSTCLPSLYLEERKLGVKGQAELTKKRDFHISLNSAKSKASSPVCTVCIRHSHTVPSREPASASRQPHCPSSQPASALQFCLSRKRVHLTTLIASCLRLALTASFFCWSPQ